MLAIVTTDFPLAPAEVDSFLRPAVDATFNRISVDGECSTNDAVVLLANGASDIERDASSDEAFADALRGVCADLARQIVEDGEGATVLLEIRVAGAASDDEAVAVARRIATSPLVKTAAFGRDPNWGRVLAAAGSAPWNGGFARLDPDRLRVAFDGTAVFERGAPTGVAPVLSGPAMTIDLELGLGTGSAAYLVRPDVRLRPAERGVHDVTRVVVKLGGASLPPPLVESSPSLATVTRSWSSTVRGRRSAPSSGGAESRSSSSTAAASRATRPRGRARVAARRREHRVRCYRPGCASPRRRRDRSRSAPASRLGLVGDPLRAVRRRSRKRSPRDASRWSRPSRSAR